MRSKSRRRERWATEFGEFCTQYGDDYHGATAEAGEAAPNLFVASVAQAVLSPPDEAEAARLWAILSREKLTGTSLGSLEQVPLGGENVGMRMLLALGWKPGTGLGADGTILLA